MQNESESKEEMECKNVKKADSKSKSKLKGEMECRNVKEAENESESKEEMECKNVKKAVLFGQELCIPEMSAFDGSDLAEVVITLCRDCYFDRLSIWVSSFDGLYGRPERIIC
jgi:hypothetical protein